MVLDMANSDATSATVKVLVSFYFVLTDESSSSARTSAIHKGKLNAGVPLSGDELNVLSSIVKHLKTGFTGLAEIAKGKRLGEKPEVMIVISCSSSILTHKKLFLFCRNL